MAAIIEPAAQQGYTAVYIIYYTLKLHHSTLVTLLQLKGQLLLNNSRFFKSLIHETLTSSGLETYG
jgi:hypothetical protein